MNADCPNAQTITNAYVHLTTLSERAVEGRRYTTAFLTALRAQYVLSADTAGADALTTEVRQSVIARQTLRLQELASFGASKVLTDADMLELAGLSASDTNKPQIGGESPAAPFDIVKGSRRCQAGVLEAQRLEQALHIDSFKLQKVSDSKNSHPPRATPQATDSVQWQQAAATGVTAPLNTTGLAAIGTFGKVAPLGRQATDEGIGGGSGFDRSPSDGDANKRLRPNDGQHAMGMGVAREANPFMRTDPSRNGNNDSNRWSSNSMAGGGHSNGGRGFALNNRQSMYGNGDHRAPAPSNGSWRGSAPTSGARGGRGSGPARGRGEGCDDGNDPDQGSVAPDFMTGADKLYLDEVKKYGRGGAVARGESHGGGGGGGPAAGLMRRRGVGLGRRGFTPPIAKKEEDLKQEEGEEEVDPRLKGIDPKMVELITSEILDRSPEVTWDDIAGLEFAKKSVQEIVVWPLLRPDLFTGLRGPPKGMLLFGPPGTGKTMIGKAIATESGATFFSISASSMMSKWIGEGEKMVKALFAVASIHQPAVIFIDEIDSLLTARSESENEASRRVKTEFLVQWDGVGCSAEDRILLIGATNRPQELDDAARRRMVKRLYIPLPDAKGRKQLVKRLLEREPRHSLSEEDVDTITERSAGYSGSDINALCKEAAMGPIRSTSGMDIRTLDLQSLRHLGMQDFVDGFRQVRASVSQSEIAHYLEWNEQFGSFAAENVTT